jgi:hypothetical protein
MNPVHIATPYYSKLHLKLSHLRRSFTADLNVIFLYNNVRIQLLFLSYCPETIQYRTLCLIKHRYSVACFKHLGLLLTEKGINHNSHYTVPFTDKGNQL